MKKFEITEEQIKELAKGNKKVERMFPEIFETKLELNRWYKRENCEDSLVFLTKQESENVYSGYGICNGTWESNYIADNEIYKCIPATEEEVKSALIKEAKRRGFKKGAKFKSCISENNELRTIEKFRGRLFDFYFNDNGLTISTSKNEWIQCQSNPCIFKDGIWAESVKAKCLTKKQAEEELTKFKNDGYEYQIID